MFKLQKENVIKIVDSSLKRDRLINEGFALVQPLVDSIVQVEEESYQNLNFFDLQKVAKEKGINTYKLKKEELIKALEDLEEGD